MSKNIMETIIEKENLHNRVYNRTRKGELKTFTGWSRIFFSNIFHFYGLLKRAAQISINFAVIMVVAGLITHDGSILSFQQYQSAALQLAYVSAFLGLSWSVLSAAVKGDFFINPINQYSLERADEYISTQDNIDTIKFLIEKRLLDEGLIQ